MSELLDKVVTAMSSLDFAPNESGSASDCGVSIPVAFSASNIGPASEIPSR